MVIAAVSTPGKILYGKTVSRNCIKNKCVWGIGKECVVIAVARKLLG